MNGILRAYQRGCLRLRWPGKGASQHIIWESRSLTNCKDERRLESWVSGEWSHFD
jgi:hypothetical protein